MNRKFAIFAFLLAAMFIGLPMETSASSAVKETTVTTGSAPQIRVVVGQPGRRYRRGYWRSGRYYRNYGQYRRTQVGWRRNRMIRQYYWRDGRRYTRYNRYYNYR